jgi:hypothetical protein
MKQTKRAIVLEALDGRDLTMADLVTVTGLTRPQIATGLYEVLQMGILKTEMFRQPGDRMRRRAIYSLESAA